MEDEIAYEVYAIRFGHLERSSKGNFLGGDSHDVPMPLDYYVWAIVGDGRVFMVDTGFDEATGRKRSRRIVTPVEKGLRTIGVDPAAVQDVILTHMHFDHGGNIALFPNARFHVQDGEMAFCTGRCMCHDVFRHHFEAEDVSDLVYRLFDGNVRLHDGDSDIAPGISVHLVGGHTAGLQVVRVRAGRGWVVLASDATHFYANIEQNRPFPAIHDLERMMEGFATVRRLADSSDHIIPGHDPEVLQRYPAVSAETEGWIVRVDRAPCALAGTRERSRGS